MPTLRALVRLLPPAPERMELEEEPKAHTVASYVFTEAAARAWELINRESGGGPGRFFWIGGAAGAGKTHFLNYVLAWERSAGARCASEERRLTLVWAAPTHGGAARLEADLLEALACELGVGRREVALWRALDNAEGLRVALSEARRLGVRRMTFAADLGACDPGPALEYFKAAAAVIKSSKLLPVMMLAAARCPGPPDAVNLEVAPGSTREAMLTAAARARELTAAASELIGDFYADAQSGGERIFPFHPETLRALAALAPPGLSVGGLARLAREALAGGERRGNLELRRLLLPSDLTASGALARRAGSVLGDEGRAALRAAYAAAASAGGEHAEPARRIVDSLMLASLDGRELLLEELCAIPAQPSAELTARMLGRLARASKGAIRFDGARARFNPHLPQAHQLSQFNAAVPTLRRLEPSLSTVREAEELEAMTARLGNSAAEALELASQASARLSALARTLNTEVPLEHLRRLGEIVALLSRGPSALVAAAAEPSEAERLTGMFEAFRGLTGAAALAPRVLAMRQYLEEAGLLHAEDPGSPPAVSAQSASGEVEQFALDEPAPLGALRMQARLSATELNFRLSFASRGAFEAAEARFQKFRAEYAQYYRAAHEQWRAQMTRLERLARDAALLLGTLNRLNSIASLGVPQGANLASELASHERQISVCDGPDPSLAEEGARCARCGYVLGADAPRLDSTLEEIRRAIQSKLACLSQSAIRRLIKAHDRVGRLEGFLKIVQAAQTDALARVLDDELAGYLRALLDETPTSDQSAANRTFRSDGSQKRLFGRRQSTRALYQRAATLDRSRRKPPPSPK